MVLIAESVKGRAVLPLLIQPSMLVASHLAALLQAGLSGGERPVMPVDRASRAFPAAIGGYGTRLTRALGPAQKGEVQMHKIIVNECMSFNGVAQSPARTKTRATASPTVAGTSPTWTTPL